MRRLERAGDDLQQRRFTATVRSDNAGGGAGLDLQTNILERPELAVPFPTAASK